MDTFKLLTPNMQSGAIGVFQGELNDRFREVEDRQPDRR